MCVGSEQHTQTVNFYPNTCSDEFEYPWFPEVLSRSEPYTPYPEWRTNPPDETRNLKMFRLPVVDIDKIKCTASPFLFAGHADDPSQLRPRRSSAGFPAPCK